MAVQQQKRLYDQRAVRRLFTVGDWVMHYYPAVKKSKLDSVWVGPSLVVSIVGWAVGIHKHPDSPIILIHCQDVTKVPQPNGMRSWIMTPQPVGAPPVPVLGASTVAHTSRGSPSVDVLPPEEGPGLSWRMWIPLVCNLHRDLRCLAGLGWTLMVRGWLCRRALSPRRALLSWPLFFGCGPYSADENCPCIQLSDGCPA